MDKFNPINIKCFCMVKDTGQSQKLKDTGQSQKLTNGKKYLHLFWQKADSPVSELWINKNGQKI